VNTTLRRLASVVMVMFLALMVSTTWIQYVQADSLNDDNRNARKIYREIGRPRGPIVVGEEAVALSKPVDDQFGYQRIYGDGDAERASMFSPLTGHFSLFGSMTGIENTENDFLSGQADALWVDRLRNLLTGTSSEGSSVELTIDPEAQQAAWDGLGDQRGAVVALDPSTGAILAMVSKPSYDPNVVAVHRSKDAREAFEALLNDDDDPLINRTTSTLYPPGSTFKLVVSAAALESGDYQADTQIDAPYPYLLPGTQTPLPNFGNVPCPGNGRITLADALRVSCNTAFAELGVELGAEALYEQSNAFGFGTRHEVPMTTAASSYPDPDTPNFSDDLLAQSGIGQWDVKVTPLQVAMVSAAIANDGELMAPYAVQTVRDQELEVVQEASPERIGQPVSSETAQALTDMMVSVVEDGSGRAAQISGVQVAGKTGTAQWKTGEDPHAWFTAFAPADDPQVAVAVIVEQGGDMGSEATGGQVAAPIAKAVIEAVLNG
jgi:peptidoglycan glycosyltransferase